MKTESLYPNDKVRTLAPVGILLLLSSLIFIFASGLFYEADAQHKGADPEVVEQYLDGHDLADNERAFLKQFYQEHGLPGLDIVGGQDADIADYPWQVGLSVGTSPFCGGSVLSNTWILTAAHCLEDLGDFGISSITIFAGVSDFNDASRQNRTSDQLILHPDYIDVDQGNDIAVISLLSPLNLSDPNVAAIPISTQAHRDQGFEDPDVISTITGWGALSSGGEFPDILQVAEVPIVATELAQTGYDPHGITLLDDMIAAGLWGVGGVDACQGDSGGPLAVPDAASPVGFVVAGITSWGFGCAEPNFMGIYARVSAFESWLETNTGLSWPQPGDTPPAISIDPQSFQFSLEPGQTTTDQLTITNTGDGVLSVNLSDADGQILSALPRLDESFSPSSSPLVALDEFVTLGAGQLRSGNISAEVLKRSQSGESLLSAEEIFINFSTDQGFTTGSISGQQGWVAASQQFGSTTFGPPPPGSALIVDNLASSGDQSLVFQKDNTFGSDWLFYVQSPLLDISEFNNTFLFEFDARITAIDGADYNIILIDPQQGLIARLQFEWTGSIGWFVGSQPGLNIGQWEGFNEFLTFSFEVNDSDELIFAVGGVPFVTSDSPFENYDEVLVQLVSDNYHLTDTGHFDNIRLTQGEPSWLSYTPAFTTVQPGASENIALSIDAGGLEPGTYERTLQLSTNDPANPIVNIPVTLSVGISDDFSISIEGPHEGWRMLTSPVAGITYGELLSGIWTQGFPGSDFEDTESTSVFRYDEPTRNWQEPDHADSPFGGVPGFSGNSGRAAITWVYEDDDYDGTPDGWPKVLNVAGVPHTGEVAVELSHTETSPDDGNAGWHIIGNPFPFPIDWQLVADDSSALDGVSPVMYVYDANLNDGQGGYLTHFGNGIADANTHSGVMEPFQAFFVRTQGDENGTVTFKESHAVEPGVPVSTSDSPFRYAVISLGGGEHHISEKALLTFKDDEIRTSERPVSLSIPVYEFGFTGAGNRILSYRNLPLTDGESITLPLHFAASEEGGFMIDALLPEFDGREIELTLTDLQTGTEHSLKPGSPYHFTHTLSNTAAERIETAAALSPREALTQPDLLNLGKEERFLLTVSAGTFTSAGNETELPKQVALSQNYPNPFNPATIINWELPESGDVRLEVYNLQGQLIAVLENGFVQAGRHQSVFDGSRLASGIYFYRLSTGSKLITRKMTLIK